MNRPIVIGLVLFAIIFTGLVLFLRHRQAVSHQAGGRQPGIGSIEKGNAAINQRRINVKLLFSDQENTFLLPEERAITYQENLASETREVLKALIQGPADQNLVGTIPDGTQLLDVFITKDGIAYADFSHELADNQSGGSLAEINTVFSIVNTLTMNFPQIKKVQILLNDQVVETLKGHVDVSHPLEKDLSAMQATSKQQPSVPETQTSDS